jgi:hypothetical protein
VDSLTFYFDRCFGKRFPEALLKMQTPFKVEYHHSPTNKFPEEMEDDEWLRIVGAKNWIVFSHDKKWHDESPAIAAIKEHKSGASIFGAQAFLRGTSTFVLREPTIG